MNPDQPADQPADLLDPDPASERGAHLLREQFDRSFAMAPDLPAAGSANLLTIRIGSELHAIRLADIRGLYADRRILALPSPMPELLGVTSFRGQIVPVYHLAALLGMPASKAPRWMILAPASAPLAFAFDAFEAHICAGPEQLIGTDEAAQQYDAVRTGSAVVPVLGIDDLVGQIELRCKAQQMQQVQPR